MSTETRRAPAVAALHYIARAGFETGTPPTNCQGSAEQAGFNAFENGFLTLDAMHLSQRYVEDDSDDGQRLTEWLAGFWRAHDESSPCNSDQ